VLGIDDPQLVDGATPPGGDAGDGCHGTSLVKVCIVPGPTDPLVLANDATIDTDTDARCGNFGGLCVFAGTSVAVDAGITVTVRGTRPFVLVATEGDATIDGTLDLASSRGGALGAGADATSCLIGTPPQTSGGGFGASYIGAGGNGGAGAAGSGGIAAIASDIVRFAGGCPGGAGSGGELGGDGGGAVYILGETGISVRGKINASGAGGSGGAGSVGGGGGGSGGMIGLEAPAISIAGTAAVFANGGGGGEGGNGSVQGSAGEDAVSAVAPARGGSGATAAGGDGGNGAAGATGALPGGTAVNNGGGGGGGGGAGVVWVIGVLDSTGVISPAPLP